MKRSLFTAFTIIIALCLSILTVNGQEKEGSAAQQPANANMFVRLLMRVMDLNKDGWLSLEEHSKFFMDVDKDKNGYLSRKEVMEFIGDIIKRESGGPEVGQKAPDFALRTLEGDKVIKLSDFRGKKPVVLVFGSYT